MVEMNFGKHIKIVTENRKARYNYFIEDIMKPEWSLWEPRSNP